MPKANKDIFPGVPVIETERLLLRKLKLSDAPAVFAMENNETIWKYDNDFYPRHTSLDETRNYIRLQQANYKRLELQNADLAIVSKETGRLIGRFGLWHFSREHRHISVVYNLSPEHWGQGFATEIFRAVIVWIFANTGIHRIWAMCHPDNNNIASERVMQKSGMTKEAFFRDIFYSSLRQRFCSYKQYSILSTDVPS